MKAVLCLGFAGAATAAADPRRETIRFPFNMPKGQKPTGGVNFMANCMNFVSAMSSTGSNAHTLKCHADGKLCDAWANALPDVIKAKHSGEASHNKALSTNHWCDAVRLAQDPQTMPVTNFKADSRAKQHKVEQKVEQKVQQKGKVTLKAKVQHKETEHEKLMKQAQKLREQAEEAKAKAAKAKEEAEDKKSVAEMMKELSTKAKRELEERNKKGHKESLVAKAVTDTSDSKYQELVNKIEHKATVEAPKAAAAPKAEKTIQHHGWEGVLATEDKMEAEHRGVRGGDFVQKASSPTHSESRIGHFVEEIYDDVASLVHRVV